MLGPLEVRNSDGSNRAIGGPRQRALLAALLTSPGQAITMDSLVEAVWAADQPERPRRALQVSIARLRATLGKDRIDFQDNHYWLALAAGDTVDSILLEQAAAGGVEPCESLVRWRGSPFAELADWHPAQVRIAALTELRASAAIRCLDSHLDDRRFDIVVVKAKELLVDYPYDERLWTALVEALQLDGRQAEAVDACHQMRQKMYHTLGLNPSPAFIDLETRILMGVQRELDQPNETSTHTESVGLPGLLDRVSARPFAGRDDELARLRKHWSEAKDGRTQLVLVTGEPGIGKTHLVAKISSEIAEQGCHILFGSGSPQQPALAPLAEALNRAVADLERLPLSSRRRGLLGRVVPDLAPAEPPTDDSEHDRAEFAEALAHALAELSAKAPTVLVLDDLHWAGRSTFRAVGDVIRTRPDLPLLVVATMRDVPPDTSRELEELTAELLRLPSSSRLPLTGLDDGEVLEILDDSWSRADAVALRRQTAGSPLFVTQLAARKLAINDRVTDLSLAINDQVERLGPDVAKTLRTAAVVGERFAVDVVLRRQRDEGVGNKRVLAALSRAEAARLLQPTDAAGSDMRFHHALVRDVLYDSWFSTERMSEHRAVADAYVSLADAGIGRWSGQIAWHLHHAGPFADVDECVRHARFAAKELANAAAAAEAGWYYSLPLALETLDEHTRCELLVAKAEMEGLAGQDGQSATTSLEAAALAAKNGWIDLLVRSALSCAPTSGRWVNFMDGAAGVGLVETARQRAPDQSVEQARLALREACFNVLTYTVDQRRRLCDPAIAVIRRAGSPEDRLLGMMDAYWALQNSLRPPFDLYEELVELSRELATPRARWLGFMAEHADAWYRPDLTSFGKDAKPWRDVAERLGPAERYWAAISSSCSAFVGGRLDDGRSQFEAARGFAVGQTSDMWRRGNGPTIAWFASAIYSDPTIGNEFVAGINIRGVLVKSLLCLLGPEQIRGEVHESTRDWDWERNDMSRSDLEPPSGGEIATLTGLGAIYNDNPPLAKKIYELLLPIREAMAGTPWNPLPVTHFVLGRLAEYLGHPRTALDHFERSLELHRRYGSQPLVHLSERALAEFDT
ncbi:MAG: AAA family ATPase [Acidimicrobiales bacterium]